MLDEEEIKNIDELIDRYNLMYCQLGGNRLPDFANFFGYAGNDELFRKERQKIQEFSDLKMLRGQHRENLLSAGRRYGF